MRISDWSSDVCSSDLAFDGLARARTSATGDAGELIDALLDRRDQALRAVRIDPRGLEGSGKSRIHGDYPLGQEIGRAPSRERVGQYVTVPGVGVSINKKHK